MQDRIVEYGEDLDAVDAKQLALASRSPCCRQEAERSMLL